MVSRATTPPHFPLFFSGTSPDDVGEGQLVSPMTESAMGNPEAFDADETASPVFRCIPLQEPMLSMNLMCGYLPSSFCFVDSFLYSPYVSAMRHSLNLQYVGTFRERFSTRFPFASRLLAIGELPDVCHRGRHNALHHVRRIMPS